MAAAAMARMRAAEIRELLFRTPAHELGALARDCLARTKGGLVHLRGLVEFSSKCRRNCLYCGLRAGNAAIGRYSLSQEEILACGRRAVAGGCDTIVLQSGEGASDAQWLAELVRQIKDSLGVAVTLCVGERPKWQYALWRQAGADRYLLRHESADAALYARLHPGYSLKNRLRCLNDLRGLGYEVGTGFIVGLPWQRPESLVDDIALAQELEVAMCGVGPFMPQAQTPLAGFAQGSVELTLRVLSTLRLALPMANLPATTALATADPAAGLTNGLLAGANVIMAGFTPQGADYRIYDSKAPLPLAAALNAIEAAGRSLAPLPDRLR